MIGEALRHVHSSPRVLVALLLTLACASDPRHVANAERGAVACVEPLAAAIGAQVLAAGGHAVDAAVAVGFALAVTWPEAGNIGGGGFMLIRQADGSAAFLDYRETAPAASREDMFLRTDGSVDTAAIDRSYRGVGVPGTVAGLFAAHRRYGRLPWADLVTPAIELAERGFPVSPALAASIQAAAEKLRGCPEATRIFLPRGRALEVGATWVQRELGASLRAIRADGEDAFYRGAIARRIASDSASRGGILAAADFAGYRAVWREPLRGGYRGHEILAAPPPSSGGQVLLSALGQLERIEPDGLGGLEPGSADEAHRIAEVLRRAFLDRARFLADPDFEPAPLDRLLDDAHLDALAASFDPARATPSDSLAGDLDGTLAAAGESEQTTHFSVVDAAGNAVANTYTLEQSFGSGIVARGSGILLNDEMGDFNPKPGHSSRGGRIGTRPNRIAPGKRMLSSMCPTIVAKDGELVLVAGSPGGRTIPATVLRVITAIVDHDLDPQRALALPRVHHGLYPDRIRIEERCGVDVLSALEKRGHALDRAAAIGDAHLVARRASHLVAIADARRHGAVATPR
jgi:gamma-glutamyltranspeptidase/glutathione hydrolase